MNRSAPLLALAALGLGAGDRSEGAQGIGQLCADCHPAIVESYARTGMARAVEPIRPGELAELEGVELHSGARSYAFEQDERGARILERWRTPAEGGSGERSGRRSVALRFAIGAGILDRSYAADIGGRIWFAPLEVLSASEGHARRAVLAPGHMLDPGIGFDLPITEECLACHTDSLPPRNYPLNLVPRNHEPRGISCDACHGQGAAHVAWRERDLAGERPEELDPILDVGALGLHERLSVCARCHLQGDARIALVAGERGVPPPGGDFLDRWAVYVPEGEDSDIAFVSHVERMLQSPCYEGARGSGGKALSCELCHDPHVPLSEPAERERARAGCLLCHAGDEGARADATRAPCALPREQRGGADCVSCHMRRTEVFDLAHVRIHDHRIARRPGPSSRFEQIRLKHSRDGKLRLFTWPGTQRPALAADEGLSMMAALVARFPDVAARSVDREPGPTSRELPSYHHLRGTLLERATRYEDARVAHERALALDAGFVESELNLALVLLRLGRGAQALELCTSVLARHPRAEGALRNRALVRLALADPQGFADDLTAAQSLLPRALNAKALAEHYKRMGDRELHEAWSLEAARLGP